LTASFTYQPTTGIGIQKDGTKFHGFKYNCIYSSRSKDLFGEQVEAAKKKVASKVPGASSGLATVLVAAFSDLVLHGNDDMASYLYLAEAAPLAISDTVKKQIGDLQYDGCVCLGLVTELCANCQSATLFKKAITDREDKPLSGIQALNEENINKVYTYLTPSVQTQGLLEGKGVDTENPPDWAKELMKEAPNLDKLVQMKFDDLSAILEKDGNISSNERNAVYGMYAGASGAPVSAEIPYARTAMYGSGVNMEYAAKIEEELDAVSENADVVFRASKVLSNTLYLTTNC
jgi:hypothetical protein